MWTLRPAWYFSLISYLTFLLECPTSYILIFKADNFTRLYFSFNHMLLVFVEAWYGFKSFVYKIYSWMIFLKMTSVPILAEGYFLFKGTKCILALLCFQYLPFFPCKLVTQSCLTLCYPMDCSPPGSSVHEIFPGKDTGVGCHFLLQGIFPTQGSNPGLLHCRQILYRVSYKLRFSL